MKYPSIKTVYCRDPETRHRTLLDGQFADPSFAYLASNKWTFTEKVDGTNIRVEWDGEVVGFCGRNDHSLIPDHLLDALRRIFNPRKMAEALHQPVVLYGEGYGPGIQKVGRLYRDDPSFVLFDVVVGNRFVARHTVEAIAAHAGIECVPIIGTGTLFDMIARCQEGFASQWGDFNAEGIVARPSIDLWDVKGQRIITKCKHRDFATSS